MTEYVGKYSTLGVVAKVVDVMKVWWPKAKEFIVGLGGRKWEIFCLIIVLWLIGTAGIFIEIYDSDTVKGSKFAQAVTASFLSLGGLGVVLPTYLNVFNAIEAQTERKLENTFSLIKAWDDPHLHDARQYTRGLKDRESSLDGDELVSEINSNDDLRHSVILVINYFDHVRLSLKYKRVNTEVIKESIGPVVMDINARLRPFVESVGPESRKHWDELAQLVKPETNRR